MLKWKRRNRFLPRISDENIEKASDFILNATKGLNMAAFTKGAIIALITGLSQLNPDYAEALVEEVVKIISTH